MSVETIVAVATPPGRGGVGIVRLSGSHAYAIAQKLNANQSLSPRLASYCSFYQDNKQIIDQGLLIYFKAPHSFTGEDVIEIHAHGSPIVLDLLVKECLSLGARLARPGEFSERAFLNDKIDLTQAEAIADLIQAQSETAARLALSSLQGEFSKKINRLNEQLIHLRLFVEASIDFPEEEIDFLNDGRIAQLLQSALKELEEIRAQATQGSLIRDGLSLVLVGRPNVGKSTLINHLAAKDVAIVTEIPGTTRDVMREHILLDDIPLHIIDTAGLRESHDLVEKEGIKRTWSELKKADCVLFMIDLTLEEQDLKLTQEIRGALPPTVPIITVFNKMDLLSETVEISEGAVALSAKLGLGIEELKEKIKQAVGYQPNEGQIFARRRHLHALDRARDLLLTGQIQLMQHQAGELLAEDLRLAHKVLGEITGEFSSDDLLGTIFSSFCIGK